MKTVTLPVKGLNFAGCARQIEKRLGKLESIAKVEASYVSQTVTVTYDEDRLGEGQLREMVKDCGFACGEPMVASPSLAPATTEPGMHEMMDHDMSNPAMARAMEAEMRSRFFVSLVLTIPIILYSSLGTTLLRLHLPTPFGIHPNWVLLVLSTPVVWLDISRGSLASSAESDTGHERAGQPGRAGRLPLQCLCHPVRSDGRYQLRRRYARHLRALWTLDGDAQPSRVLGCTQHIASSRPHRGERPG